MCIRDRDIDELKLDRVFLSDTAEKEKRDIIMKNIITLARELQITTVTEGVEDAAQAEFIHSIHCDICLLYTSIPIRESSSVRAARCLRQSVPRPVRK